MWLSRPSARAALIAVLLSLVGLIVWHGGQSALGEPPPVRDNQWFPNRSVPSHPTANASLPTPSDMGADSPAVSKALKNRSALHPPPSLSPPTTPSPPPAPPNPAGHHPQSPTPTAFMPAPADSLPPAVGEEKLPVMYVQQQPWPRPKSSQSGKFLFGCILSGRHHNQLYSWGKLYHIARRTHRTFILPNFIQAPNLKSEAEAIRTEDLRTIPTVRIYNLTALAAGPVKLITQREFFATRRHVLAACIGLRACLPFPRQLQCKVSCLTWIGCNENVLALGEWVFRMQSTPPFHTDCFWGLLRPTDLLLPAIQEARRGLPRRYLAVHQRTFGKQCPTGLEVFWRRFRARVPAGQCRGCPQPTSEPCQMSPAYVRRFLPEANQRFFVGTDHYHPEWTDALRSVGGVLYSPPKFPPPINILAGMLIDFWVFVEADVFIGNPLSTFSFNVCAVRWMLNKSCPNIPRPDNTSRCFVYDLVL